MSDRSAGLEDVEADSGLHDLYRLYSGWLASRLRRRFGDDTDDIVQEVYLRIAPYSRLGVIQSPKAVLIRIAVNLATDQHRRRQRRDRHATQLLDSAGWGIEPASQTDEVLTRQLILGLPQPLRDRIVIGEMRDGAAALETLKSWNTGHPGGLSTVHANSAGDALRRVEDLIAEVSTQVPQRTIGEAVDRVVHIRRTGAGRRVDAVIAVEGFTDGHYQVRDLA